MLKCPRCDGAGKSTLIGCGESGCRVMETPCSLCEGKGEISEEQAVWVVVGKRLQDDRKERNEILRQAADRFGLTQVELSRFEQGRVDPRSFANPCDLPDDYDPEACPACVKHLFCLSVWSAYCTHKTE